MRIVPSGYFQKRRDKSAPEKIGLAERGRRKRDAPRHLEPCLPYQQIRK